MLPPLSLASQHHLLALGIARCHDPRCSWGRKNLKQYQTRQSADMDQNLCILTALSEHPKNNQHGLGWSPSLRRVPAPGFDQQPHPTKSMDCLVYLTIGLNILFFLFLPGQASSRFLWCPKSKRNWTKSLTITQCSHPITMQLQLLRRYAAGLSWLGHSNRLFSGGVWMTKKP